MAIEDLATWTKFDPSARLLVTNAISGITNGDVRHGHSSNNAFNDEEVYLAKSLGAITGDFSFQWETLGQTFGQNATRPWGAFTVTDSPTLGTQNDLLTQGANSISIAQYRQGSSSYQYRAVVNGDYANPISQTLSNGVYYFHKLYRIGTSVTWEVWSSNTGGTPHTIGLLLKTQTWTTGVAWTANTVYVQQSWGVGGDPGLWQQAWSFQVNLGIAQVYDPPTLAIADKRTDTSNTSTETLSVGVESNDIRQRVIGTHAGDVTVAGDYTNDTDPAKPSDPTMFEARVMSGAVEVLTWTDISAAIDTVNNTFSGTLTGVPEGGPYTVEVRGTWPEAGVVTDATSAATWGVGIRVLLYGQSQANKMDTEVSASPPTLNADGFFGINTTNVSHVNAATETADGHVEILNGLWDTHRVPIGIVNKAVGGTALIGAGNWEDPASTLYTITKGGVYKFGSAIEYATWMQGEEDGKTVATTKAAYLASLGTLFAQTRTDFGANLPILLTPLGRRTDGLADSYGAIREAQFEKVATDPNTYMGGQTLDLQLQDVVHYSARSCGHLGRRLVKTMDHIAGIAGWHRGPRPVGYKQINATTFEIYLRTDPGYSIEFNGSVNGLEIADAGVAAVISNITLAGDTLTVTTSAVVGAVTVRMMNGIDGGAGDAGNPPGTIWTYTDHLLDSIPRTAGAQNLPIEMPGLIPEAGALSETIYSKGGAVRANLAGLSWWVFEGVNPDKNAAPIDSGSGGTTDGAGLFSVPLRGTTLAAGASVTLSIADATMTEVASKVAVLI